MGMRKRECSPGAESITSQWEQQLLKGRAARGLDFSSTLASCCLVLPLGGHLIYQHVRLLIHKAAKVTRTCGIVAAVKKKKKKILRCPKTLKLQSLCTSDSPGSMWGKPLRRESRDVISCINSALYIARQCFKSLKRLDKFKMIIQGPKPRRI